MQSTPRASIRFFIAALLVAGMNSLLSAADKFPLADTSRLPSMERFLAKSKNEAWSKDLREIPPTVVDKGPLRNVPYSSFKSGNYELNVYGDPDKPCCIEMGIRDELLNNAGAKQNYLDFVKSLLTDRDDRLFLRTLNLKQDLQKREGMSFEITPETAEDAYGGWWVSVYDDADIEKSRATDKEMELITVKRELILGQKASGNDSTTTSNVANKGLPTPLTFNMNRSCLADRVLPPADTCVSRVESRGGPEPRPWGRERKVPRHSVADRVRDGVAGYYGGVARA